MNKNYICPCCNTVQHPQVKIQIPEPIGQWGVYIASYYFCPVRVERYADDKLRKNNDDMMLNVCNANIRNDTDERGNQNA